MRDVKTTFEFSYSNTYRNQIMNDGYFITLAVGSSDEALNAVSIIRLIGAVQSFIITGSLNDYLSYEDNLDYETLVNNFYKLTNKVTGKVRINPNLLTTKNIRLKIIDKMLEKIGSSGELLLKESFKYYNKFSEESFSKLYDIKNLVILRIMEESRVRGFKDFGVTKRPDLIVVPKIL